MGQERAVAPMGGFFKFTAIGQQVIGVVKRYGTGDNGPFIVMEPALARETKADELRSWQSLAVGLSTDLALKVQQGDVGKYFSLRFKDTEPTKKGSRKKIFEVLELDRDELVQFAAGADRTNRNVPYSRADASLEDDSHSASEDDDLPF